MDKKDHGAKAVFVYCKPYGLVQINMYKKFGDYDEYQKIIITAEKQGVPLINAF